MASRCLVSHGSLARGKDVGVDGHNVVVNVDAVLTSPTEVHGVARGLAAVARCGGRAWQVAWYRWPVRNGAEIWMGPEGYRPGMAKPGIVGPGRARVRPRWRP